MTSSMLTGDRRWASARRSGMTVLGKVAVPKPINLPSQRLENHGLDPNVDIVPKGTHSWGTRSSPSTTNPWGSLNTPSPNNDGTGSPSYISGRPSSGGSGTRPSTAGSDRAQEPNSNAWGSNSRPSSASGTLTSSQSSLASLRPRSAETRPGSSQLSRFAEPSTDSSVAWGANRTAEKLGMTSAKNDGFSLTTGDFPTLGSEKETSGKSTVSEDADHGSHGRPGSSHGGAAVAKEMAGNFVGSDDGNSNIRNDASNSRRRENHMYGEDGTRNSAEKWHQDHQPYPNSNIPHHQFDAWRGPPVNSHHGGVWYRGLPPPGGPPFGSPVGPGGFPMEPFPYYRPHIPPGTLNNPPPTGAGLRGPRPKNGDMYRPHMPDAYMRPGAPIRPGFYPGPIAFDGYYGHPMGYCSSNERDIPFMGMPMGPAAYNPYSGQNVPDPGNSRGRTHGPSSKGLVSDQMESGHLQDGRGPYKVLLKQHDGWEGRDEQKWDENATVPYLGKGDHPKKSWENGWRGHHKEVEMDTTRRAIHEEGFSESSDNRGSDSAKVPEDAGHLKASDDSTVKDKEQFEPLLVPSKDSPVPREPSLIQKIEGLNAKARASDGRQDALSASSREEQKKNFQANDGKKIASVSEAATVSESFGNPDLNTSSNEGGMSTGGSVDLMVFGGTTTSRKSTHGMHGGTDRRAKGRFNSQETDGWRKIPQAKEPPILVSPTVQIESSVVQGMDSTSAGPIEEPGPHSQSKSGEPLPAVSDPNDSQSQRARMTELVKQRFKQREKEEEEREREQRAKAQAKLEELNRRTQAGEVSSQKQETVPNNAVGKIREESSAHVQHTVVGSKSKGHNSVLGPSPSAVAPSSESIIKGAEISTSLSGNALQGTTKALHKEVQGYSVPVQPEASNSGSRHHENDPHAHDIGAKQKRYRQKQQSSVEKNSSEKSIATATGPSNGDAIVLANATVSPEDMIHNNVLNCESILPVNQGVISDSSLHHKRKNRSNKSKHKVEEATSNASLPSKDASASDIVVESKKATDAKSMQDPGPVKATIDCQTTIDSKDASQLSDQGSILANEEVHGRATNQWKSQHPRKPLRNSHSSKSSEKIQNTDAVFWAPVRLHKYEVSDEANQRSADVVSPSKKNEQQVPNNTRNKRAEMERYVPKPAVKEMSQQGSSHQSATSNYQTMSDETIGKSESSTLGTEYSRTSSPVAGKVGSKVEYRHGDSHIRQNKSGKGHGAWRQRATTESSTVTSDTNRNVQKPTEHHPHQKLDSSSLKEHSRHTDDGDISDGWNIPEKSDEPVNAPDAKEQGMMIKGKRYKATGYGHHFDEKRVNSGSSEKVSVQNSLVPEMKHSQLHATSKENRSVGERSGSHWQPKASAFAATNEQGSRSNDGHDVIAEVNTSNKKDSTFHGGISLPQRNKESTVPKSQHHQDGNVEKAQVVAPKEPKEGRKIDVHEQCPVSPLNLSSSNMGTHHEQRGSSGFRKNGNQNSRFGMEHEHNGDWSGSTKDGKQHNVSAQREKQRQSSHHEYQPIGPDSSITDNTVPTKDGSRNSHGRYKERGQAQPRRSGGNFNGRRTGNVRADPNYE